MKIILSIQILTACGLRASGAVRALYIPELCTTYNVSALSFFCVRSWLHHEMWHGFRRLCSGANVLVGGEPSTIRITAPPFLLRSFLQESLDICTGLFLRRVATVIVARICGQRGRGGL